MLCAAAANQTNILRKNNMCGRYAFYLTPSDLQKRFGVENLLNFPARYNCAPMQDLPIIIKNRMGFARWGLLPPWKNEDDKSLAAKMTNARSETVQEKPTFKPSWDKARRCIIPANGFFEWMRPEDGKNKQPYFISSRSDEILNFAGLWHKCGNLVTFAILTKEASGKIANIHHRMPVMIPQCNTQEWFSAQSDKAVDIINCANADNLELYPVNTDVGNVRNDSADLLQRITA